MEGDLQTWKMASKKLYNNCQTIKTLDRGILRKNNDNDGFGTVFV